MTLVMEPERLACGTPLDLLLAYLAGERDALPAGHADSCPYCRMAANDLEPGLQHLRRQADAPAPPVPARVERAVLRRVGAGRGGSDALTLPAARPGRTTVRSSVVADVSRFAAEAVPGVVRAAADADDGWVLRVRLTVRYGLRIPDVAERVRAAVTEVLEHQVGRPPVAIDIVVDDLTVGTTR